MGKTAVLLQMLLHLARKGVKCGLLSLELPADVCVQRWVAQLSHVELSAIRDGRLDDSRWQSVSAALSTIRDLPLWVDDRPATPSQVRARIEVLRRRHGIEVVGLDYLQLVGRDTGARFGNRTEEVGAVAHALQASAKGSGVAILAAAQVNRGVQTRKDKRPVLSDLRESGDIEAVADVVVMPWRADYEGDGHEGEAEILVRKSRHGQTGDVSATWEGRYQEMMEAECTTP
jgi:replicative DNA helicase